jgi:trans-2-enoyl-CoA reductase
MDVGQTRELELDNALTGFTVVGRDDEPVGEVVRTSLDRACLFVGTGKTLVRRKPKTHAVHRSAIVEIDVDAMTITLRTTAEQVLHAPDYRDLDDRCSEDVERYYASLV